MKANTIFRRIGAMLLALGIGICSMAASAFADEKIDTAREASLLVSFGADGKGFANVAFSVYHVADLSAEGSYTLTGDFAAYAVSFADLDSSGWRALAQTLDAYAARDRLTPLVTAKTASDGTLRISDMAVGLYLVTGEPYVSAGAIYTPEPMLVTVPGMADDGTWNYQVAVSCKYSYRTTDTEKTYRKVQKVWKDSGGENRPKQIPVQLLQDGKVADTVILSQANNWEYTWHSLDSSSKWQVVESSVPSGYTVRIAQEGSLFVITNTRPSPPPNKLPQTGLLWWPVPVLLTGGLALVITGLAVRRKQGEWHER